MSDLSIIGDMFLYEIWPLYEQTLKTKKAKDNYLMYVRQICTYCNKDFLNLTKDDVANYFDSQWEQDLRKKTINMKLSIMRSISSFIVANRRRFNLPDYTNIFLSYGRIDIDTYFDEGDIPNKKEIDKLLSYCKTDKQLFCIISLVFRCALSASEVCDLCVESFIRIDSGELAILFVEGETERIVAIPSDIDIIVQPFIDVAIAKSNKHIFLNKWGKPLKLHNLQSLLKNKERENNMDKRITLQDIRNSSIFYMLFGGADFRTVSKYTNTDGRWLFRYEHMLSEFTEPPCNYMHIKIVP